MSLRRTVMCLALVMITGQVLAGPDWRDVLSRPLVSPPLPGAEPQREVVWRDQLGPAMEEAKRTGRPLFVTLRCLPCKQCADFDKAVLEGGSELDPLLKQFITVRLTDAATIDLRMMPIEGYQDLDLSWWGYFFSPEGRLYGIFGGRDHISDATRISTPALANTLQRVLEHHYDVRRPGWNIDGPPPEFNRAKPEIRELQGWDNWSAARPWTANAKCVHCHEVAEVLRQPAIDAGTFDKLRVAEAWPLPENVGIEVDRDHGLRVIRVEPGSAAERAGVQIGDELAAAGDRRLFGQADFRGVLHRGPRGAGEIELVWLRGGRVMQGTLNVEEGWRETPIDWRMSVAFGNIGAFPGFWLAPNSADTGSLNLKPHFGKNMKSPAYDAGLRPNHTVIAVDGQSPDIKGRAFFIWFRMRYEPGDTVTLTIKDGEKMRDIRYTLAPHHPQ